MPEKWITYLIMHTDDFGHLQGKEKLAEKEFNNGSIIILLIPKI